MPRPSFALTIIAFCSGVACAHVRPGELLAPTDQELPHLVRRLADMRGQIIPVGSAYLFDGDSSLIRRITSANARAVPFLIDCFSDTAASEVGLYFGGDYVVRVAAVCNEVLIHTEFFQSRNRVNAWPPDFNPYVRYDAAPETWLEAQAAWRRYLASEHAKRVPVHPSYN